MNIFTPKEKPTKSAFMQARLRVSEILKTPLNGPLDEIRIQEEGISPGAMDALKALVDEQASLNWIISPRTLSCRKELGKRLTPDESGRWLRAAKMIVLADEVFGDNSKANRWLYKQRQSFDQQSAMDIIKMEAGASLVEEDLGKIDSGYAA